MDNKDRYTVKVSSKGRITIPVELRKECGINGRTTVLIGDIDGKIVIEPSREDGRTELLGELAPWSLRLDLEDDPIQAVE